MGLRMGGFVVARGLQNRLQNGLENTMTRFVLFLIATAFPALACAQTVHQTAEGRRLEIDLPCAKTMSVVADPSLSGRVVLDATAQRPEELAQMDFDGGTAVTLKLRGWFHMAGGSLFSLHGDCWRPEGDGAFLPTLQVKLSVPPGFALAVDASGDGAYHLASGGTLDLDSSGSARIDAGALTRLTLSMSGSGDLKVAQVTGPVHADMSGSGDVAVAKAASDKVAIDQSGSAVFRIGGGAVGALAVESSGSGQVIVHGTVGEASVNASGSGDVTIEHLTGRLAQDTSGSGSVRVEQRGK